LGVTNPGAHGAAVDRRVDGGWEGSRSSIEVTRTSGQHDIRLWGSCQAAGTKQEAGGAMSRSTLMVAPTLVRGEIRATVASERQPSPERGAPATVTERRRGWILLNAVHRDLDKER
jgi:hypothetical protein